MMMNTEEIVTKCKAIVKLFNEMQEPLKVEGVEFCDGAVRANHNSNNPAKVEVHVYSGIKHLADIYGASLFTPRDYMGERLDNYLAFVSDDVMFFQLAVDNKNGEMVWR